MTIEQYKELPFKYDGHCNPVPIKEIWGWLTRRDRREIAQQLKAGKTPDITRYL